MRLTIATLGVLLACVAGCGADDPEAPGLACALTLSGAVASTPSRCTVVTSYSTATDTTTIGLFGSGAPRIRLLQVSFSRPGRLSAGTWTERDRDARSDMLVQPSEASPTWADVVGDGRIHEGRFTLELTAAAPAAVTADQEIYDVHGTLDAVLPPVPGSGARSDVTLHACF